MSAYFSDVTDVPSCQTISGSIGDFVNHSLDVSGIRALQIRDVEHLKLENSWRTGRRELQARSIASVAEVCHQKILAILIDHGKFFAELLRHNGTLRIHFITHCDGESFPVRPNLPCPRKTFERLEGDCRISFHQMRSLEGEKEKGDFQTMVHLSPLAIRVPRPSHHESKHRTWDIADVQLRRLTDATAFSVSSASYAGLPLCGGGMR